MNPIEVDSQNYESWFPGNHIQFNQFTVDILLDEEYKNYEFLHNWIISFQDENTMINLARDLRLNILSGNKVIKKVIVFHHSFPTDLGDINLDSTADDSEIITFSTNFSYQYYTMGE